MLTKYLLNRLLDNMLKVSYGRNKNTAFHIKSCYFNIEDKALSGDHSKPGGQAAAVKRFISSFSGFIFGYHLQNDCLSSLFNVLTRT